MAVAIQECYRDLFFPSSNNRIEGALVELAHTANGFRKDPRLPILIGDDNFTQLVRKGIDEEACVYKAGDLLPGPGLATRPSAPPPTPGANWTSRSTSLSGRA